MVSVRAEAAYRRAVATFSNPTLALLHGRYAPFVVACLSTIFTADRSTVSVADAHVEIQDMLDQLRDLGYGDEDPGLPVGSGREICRQWARGGWLMSQMEDDTEVYRLSAQAVEALEIAGRSGGGRALVSRSRVRTLLDSVDHLVSSTETDPTKRRAALEAQLQEVQEQIARLELGEVDVLDDDQLLEEAHNVLHLSRELPADFARVAESIKDMQRHVVTELRRDERPAGEVLREYLHRGQHIMDSTPEGRAFAGALKLIGEPEHIEALTSQLRSLIDHPFARRMHPDQRAELNAIAKRVEQGVQEVLTAQRRASHVITAQVRTHDPVRDREVDELLRQAMAAMQAWVPQTRTSDKVEPLRHMPTAAIGHLRQSLSDPRPPSSPEPLRQADDVEFLDGDTRAWGGPHYRELEEHLEALGLDEFDLREAFEQIRGQARRPVDLLGLLEIAHRNGMTEHPTISIVQAERPDGSVRSFAFEAVTAKARKEDI